MAEYIERNSVHTLVKQLEKFQMYNYNRTQSIVGISPDEMDFGIDKIPAEDVALVQHGKWEWDTEDMYRCSSCGETAKVKEVMGKPVWEYCPNCGARCDLEAET